MKRKSKCSISFKRVSDKEINMVKSQNERLKLRNKLDTSAGERPGSSFSYGQGPAIGTEVNTSSIIDESKFKI
jgi:hypothetical protein